MTTQLEIALHEKENNHESQMLLSANREHLSAQCKTVLELLKSGKRLTVREAMISFGIGDLRRRVKDLKENGYNVKGELKEGRFKEYYLG